MKYNYLTAVKDDVMEYVKTEIELAEYDTPEELEEYLNEELWIDDGVTGNGGSGSYTCNSRKAKEYVFGDTETVAEALKEFCIEPETITEKFLNEEWEWLDVTARCYTLGAAIAEAIEEISEAYDFENKKMIAE